MLSFVDDALHQVIAQRLWEQLAKAQAVQIAANIEFNRLVRESPGDLPHPDGALTIQQAGSIARVALRRYLHALKQFNDFTLNGAIPEDLLPPN